MDMFEENLKVLEEAMEQMCIDFTTDSSESESSSNEEEEEKEEETQPPSEARQAQLYISQTIFLKTDGRVVLRQRRQLEEWRQAAESLDIRKSFRQHGAGRKPTKSELDAELLAWLTCRRARHELVSVSSLRLEAARINGAEVSRSWLTRWRRRHHVVLPHIRSESASPACSGLEDLRDSWRYDAVSPSCRRLVRIAIQEAVPRALQGQRQCIHCAAVGECDKAWHRNVIGASPSRVVLFLHAPFDISCSGLLHPRDCVSLRTHIYTFKVPQEVNEVTEEKMEPTQTKEGQRKITDYFASR